MARVPLTGGAYQARSLIAAAQKCVNLFPENNPEPDSQSPVRTTHYPTPGLRFLGRPSDQPGTPDPVPVPPAPPYTTRAVSINPTYDFNVTLTPNQVMNVAGAFPIADTPLLTLSVWVNPSANAGYVLPGVLFEVVPDIALPDTAYAGATITLNGADGVSPHLLYNIGFDVRGAGGEQFAGTSAAIAIADGGRCLRLALDTNHAAGLKLASISVQGAPVSVTISADADPAFDIPLSGGTVDRAVLFQEFYQVTSNLALLDVAALWIGFGQYVTDDSKFIVAGQPVDLGASGELVTGVSPTLYFDLRGSTTPADFLVNKGAAGGSAGYYTTPNFILGGDCVMGAPTYDPGSDASLVANGDVSLYSYQTIGGSAAQPLANGSAITGIVGTVATFNANFSVGTGAALLPGRSTALTLAAWVPGT